MKRPPLPVILISSLFILAGTAGIIYHAAELRTMGDHPDAIWVLVVRLLAIVGGIFVLYGANRARWLLVVWIGYHVVLSFYHSLAEVAMHALIMVVTVIALFYGGANIYFRKQG